MLLVAFLMFIFAGTAGPDGEVVIGTVGFFGIVALLPLFLYIVFVDSRIKEAAYGSELEETSEPAAVTYGQKRSSEEKTPRPQMVAVPSKPAQARIDRDFIEELREEQLDIPHRAKEEPSEESMEGQLDIPKRMDENPPSLDDDFLDIGGSKSNRTRTKEPQEEDDS